MLLVGCAGNPAIQQSHVLLAQGHIEDSVRVLEKAMQASPDDLELRAEYFRQRDRLSSQLLTEAESARVARNFEAAQTLYSRVQTLDPNNPRAREGLMGLSAQQQREQRIAEAQGLIDADKLPAAERLLRSVVSESPMDTLARRMLTRVREQLADRERASSQMPGPGAAATNAALAAPVTLEFRETPLKSVFDMISKTSGLNFVFDRDVRTDTKATLFVRNTTIDDVVRLVLTTNQLERKQLNDNTFLIYPNTPAKVRDYVELVTRSFYLANADVKQAQALVKTVVKTRDLFVDEKLNLLIMKDTPDAVKLAERLLESLDIAEPEVMLDVEVIEISRSKLQELGLRFPDQIGYGILTPSTTSTIVNGSVTQSSTTLGGALASGYIDLNNSSAATGFVANPGLMLNLKNQITDGNILANPRIRVKNREKAKIHIGDKLPVFTTTSTANVGVAASVSYLDVGLKLDVEPNVYLDDEVGIRVGLEVSSVVKDVSGPGGSQAYQIGSRSANTVLRLKNGETQVLAGLINDEERSSANRLPGLGDLPVLGRLFADQSSTKNKPEIMLLITPHIVRNLMQPQGVGSAVSAGSEAQVGAAPVRIGPTALRSVGVGGSASGGAGTAGAPAPISFAARVAAQRAAEAAATPEASTETPVPPAPAPVAAPVAAALSPNPEVAVQAIPPAAMLQIGSEPGDNNPPTGVPEGQTALPASSVTMEPMRP